MALLASLSIGAVYVATESERRDVQNDSRAVADLYHLAVQLSDAIRDQASAVDDYLLTGSSDATANA